MSLLRRGRDALLRTEMVGMVEPRGILGTRLGQAVVGLGAQDHLFTAALSAAAAKWLKAIRFRENKLKEKIFAAWRVGASADTDFLVCLTWRKQRTMRRCLRLLAAGTRMARGRRHWKYRRLRGILQQWRTRLSVVARAKHVLDDVRSRVMFTRWAHHTARRAMVRDLLETHARARARTALQLLKMNLLARSSGRIVVEQAVFWRYARLAAAGVRKWATCTRQRRCLWTKARHVTALRARRLRANVLRSWVVAWHERCRAQQAAGSVARARRWRALVCSYDAWKEAYREAARESEGAMWHRTRMLSSSVRVLEHHASVMTAAGRIQSLVRSFLDKRRFSRLCEHMEQQRVILSLAASYSDGKLCRRVFLAWRQGVDSTKRIAAATCTRAKQRQVLRSWQRVMKKRHGALRVATGLKRAMVGFVVGQALTRWKHEADMSTYLERLEEQSGRYASRRRTARALLVWQKHRCRGSRMRNQVKQVDAAWSWRSLGGALSHLILIRTRRKRCIAAAQRMKAYHLRQALTASAQRMHEWRRQATSQRVGQAWHAGRHLSAAFGRSSSPESGRRVTWPNSMRAKARGWRSDSEATEEMVRSWRPEAVALCVWTRKVGLRITLRLALDNARSHRAFEQRRYLLQRWLSACRLQSAKRLAAERAAKHWWARSARQTLGAARGRRSHNPFARRKGWSGWRLRLLQARAERMRLALALEAYEGRCRMVAVQAMKRWVARAGRGRTSSRLGVSARSSIHMARVVARLRAHCLKCMLTRKAMERAEALNAEQPLRGMISHVKTRPATTTDEVAGLQTDATCPASLVLARAMVIMTCDVRERRVRRERERAADLYLVKLHLRRWRETARYRWYWGLCDRTAQHFLHLHLRHVGLRRLQLWQQQRVYERHVVMHLVQKAPLSLLSAFLRLWKDRSSAARPFLTTAAQHHRSRLLYHALNQWLSQTALVVRAARLMAIASSDAAAGAVQRALVVWSRGAGAQVAARQADDRAAAHWLTCSLHVGFQTLHRFTWMRFTQRKARLQAGRHRRVRMRRSCLRRWQLLAWRTTNLRACYLALQTRGEFMLQYKVLQGWSYIAARQVQCRRVFPLVRRRHRRHTQRRVLTGLLSMAVKRRRVRLFAMQLYMLNTVRLLHITFRQWRAQALLRCRARAQGNFLVLQSMQTWKVIVSDRRRQRLALYRATVWHHASLTHTALQRLREHGVDRQYREVQRLDSTAYQRQYSLRTALFVWRAEVELSAVMQELRRRARLKRGVSSFRAAVQQGKVWRVRRALSAWRGQVAKWQRGRELLRLACESAWHRYLQALCFDALRGSATRARAVRTLVAVAEGAIMRELAAGAMHEWQRRVRISRYIQSREAVQLREAFSILAGQAAQGRAARAVASATQAHTCRQLLQLWKTVHQRQRAIDALFSVVSRGASSAAFCRWTQNVYDAALNERAYAHFGVTLLRRVMSAWASEHRKRVDRRVTVAADLRNTLANRRRQAIQHEKVLDNTFRGWVVYAAARAARSTLMTQGDMSHRRRQLALPLRILRQAALFTRAESHRALVTRASLARALRSWSLMAARRREEMQKRTVWRHFSSWRRWACMQRLTMRLGTLTLRRMWTTWRDSLRDKLMTERAIAAAVEGRCRLGLLRLKEWQWRHRLSLCRAQMVEGRLSDALKASLFRTWGQLVLKRRAASCLVSYTMLSQVEPAWSAWRQWALEQRAVERARENMLANAMGCWRRAVEAQMRRDDALALELWACHRWSCGIGRSKQVNHTLRQSCARAHGHRMLQLKARAVSALRASSVATRRKRATTSRLTLVQQQSNLKKWCRSANVQRHRRSQSRVAQGHYERVLKRLMLFRWWEAVFAVGVTRDATDAVG